MRRAAALAALVATWSGPASGAAVERVALVVGNNRGMSDEIELRYAESDAVKVQRVLVELGGYDPERTTLLTGLRAPALLSHLEALARARAVESAAPRRVLFFYFSGHSDGRHLHMSGTRLPLRELRRRLAQAGADISILVVDSCQSGALTRGKGATLGPSYEIEVLDAPDVSGQIVITSSTTDEISQESDKLLGSFFTYHWVAGLYGPADANQDDLVSLEEAYRHAYFRTVEQTIESRGGVQHPSYSFDLAGQGELIMANLTHSTARLEIMSAQAPGTYFVLDQEKQLVLTELSYAGAGPAAIRLPPGAYRVRKRERGRLLVQDVDARTGEPVRVEDRTMVAVPYKEEGRKGAAAALGVVRHGPTVALGGRSGLISQMSPALQLRLGYGASWAWLALEPRLVVRRAEVGPNGARFHHLEYDLGLFAGLRRELEEIELAIGLDGGLVVYQQIQMGDAQIQALSGAPPEGAIPVGLQGGLTARLHRPLVAGVALVLSANAGIALFSQDERAVVRPVVGGACGVSYQF